jgi:hypothetical protein
MFMTERPLYARLALLILFWLCVLSGWAAAQGSQQGCAACLGVTLSPGQALLLPDRLHGITILFVDDGTTDESLQALAELVRARGGVPAVLTVAGTSPDAQYAARVRLTELRARLGADVLLALEGPLDGSALAYADVVVGPAGAPPVGRFWSRLPGSSLAVALESTASGGVERWIIAAPDDVVEARRLLLDLAHAAAPPPGALTDSVEVRGTRRLTADEIVARHQAFAKLQTSRVTRTISTGRLTLTFDAPGFPAPVTIASKTIIYTAPGQVDLEQREVEVNGIAFTGGRIPRLPILEPERAAALPLTITLTDLYRYRLEGEGDVDGVRCYVVAFEPRMDGTSLFSGRAWVAIESFAMVRVAATQTNLRGAIVSSEQVDTYREFVPGIWLLARSDVRQLYEGAAHRTPIHRLLTIVRHEIDPSDFGARRLAAYASNSIMLRDTPTGYRYLERTSATSAEREEGIAPVRVTVAEPSTRIRTLAGGVIIDPNISVPLPFAGLSYVDFDLFGTGTQLNAFFGGSYAHVAFSMPSVAGSRWQLAGRAFGIASSYNDRAFRNGTEIYDENLRQRPAHASAWLLRPVSPRVSLRVGYEFDYTRLQSAAETSPAFAVPANQIVHGLRLALEGQRAGWAGSLWWNPAWRQGWRAWGRTPGRTGDDYSPDHASFQRFGASVSRSAAPAPRLSTKVEAAVMAGADLDRFSRFAFGTFDNRLRGYPSALIRYDRGGVVRGAAAWSAAPFVRLDGFVDIAYVRDRGYGRGYRNYTGVGAAVESPAPFGMLAALEWGYGFRGLDADGARGTHVIRVSAYKLF